MQALNFNTKEIKENIVENQVKSNNTYYDSFINFSLDLSKVSYKFKKNLSVKIGSSHSYSYIDINTILRVVKLIMAKNDLYLDQDYEKIDGEGYVVTTITHRSGEKRVSRLPFLCLETKNMNNKHSVRL